MSQERQPYVGVTGFMWSREVNEALSAMPAEANRRLMVGVLVSSKTLAGQQNKWPGRYPLIRDVADIFPSDSRALNLVHYSTDNPQALYCQLKKICGLGGPNLHGFQLNISWPQLSEIAKFRMVYPKKFLVLQIRDASINELGPMDNFLEILGNYTPFVDSILIDSSGGQGKSFNPLFAANYLWHIKGKYPSLGIGIAGGICPSTLCLLENLIPDFPELSIDAEGRLRTTTGSLCLDLMQEYLRRAFPMFKEKAAC